MTWPNPFECSITPRTPQHAEMIKRDFLGAVSAFEPFEHDLDEDDKIFVEKQREEVRAAM